MADKIDESGLSRSEVLIQNQKKEKKILQAKIQGLKHSIPKGDKKKKKDVFAEITKLETDLKEKHDQELRDLDSEEPKTEKDENIEENGAKKAEEDASPEDDSKSENVRVTKAQRRKDKKALKDKAREELIAQQEEFNVTGVRNIEAAKLNKILQAKGLSIFEVPSDGNCMYKAIEHQLKLQEIAIESDALRNQTAEFMRNHPDEFMPFLTSPKTGDAMTPVEFDKFCDETARTTVWGGQLELRALSQILKRTIEVVQAEGSDVLIGEEYKALDPLIISYHRHAFRSGEHYNSVAPLLVENNEHDHQT